MGYGLLQVEGKEVTLLDLGVLKPGGIKDNYKRLQLIFNTVSGLITQYKPNDFAIEAPFFGKNVQSMLKLGRAQGVAIAAAIGAGLPVTEYSPKKVKQSITGNGNADKEQVWKMLNRIVPLKHTLKYYDASDALAVAVCHHFDLHSPIPSTSKKKKTGTQKKSTWEAFVKTNPERLRKS